MTNSQIAQAFYQVADYLEFDGVAFKPQAYRRAAERIQNLDFEVCHHAEIKALKKVEGIGENIAQKIIELCQTGELTYLKKMQSEIKVDLAQLQTIEGLGLKKIKKLALKLDIKNISDLKIAAEKGLIRKIEGFGPKSEENLLKRISLVEERTHRFPYGKIAPTVQALLEKIRNIPEVEKTQIAGSFRRHRSTIGDLDILIITQNAAKVSQSVRQFPEIREIIASGASKMSFDLKIGLRTDLRFLEAKSFGSALLYFTGNKSFNVKMRSLAIRQNLKLNEYGLFDQSDRCLASQNEEDIFQKLKLNFIPPECRTNNGEIEIAQQHSFDFIVPAELPRGDLHMHTHFSDGSNSIEEMVQKALSIGHQYIAISDHTGHLPIANPLDEAKFTKYFAEIERLNQKYPQITILKGGEVNILSNGELDLEEKFLQQLDFVIGSVHTGMQDFDNVEKNTQRYLKALDNPYLNLIGHPTTRILNKKAELQFDYAAVFQKAKTKQVALELNSTPRRLDLPVHLLRLAKSIGTKIIINTDSHNSSSLDNQMLGVYQARRAMLAKTDILNYLNLKEFLAWLKK